MVTSSNILNISVADNGSLLANGSVSPDNTPVINVSISGQYAAIGEWVNVFNNGAVIGAVQITANDLSNGYVSFQEALPDGSYHLTSTLSTDPAYFGEPSPPTALQNSANSFNLTIGGTAATFSPITVAGDNVVTPSEDHAGIVVTGSVGTDPALANGNAVKVQIFHTGSSGSPVLVGQATGTIDAAGNYNVVFPANLPLPVGGYSVKVAVTDSNGVVSSATSTFTSALCFMAVTRILTPEGEVAVETLKAGDLVTTSEGKVMPVRWLGRQSVAMVFADPLKAQPIRIKAGALAANVPARDLLISPDHAVLVEGVLVQAGALVNGSTITREVDCPQNFTYYHVELTDHSLVMAENTPAETFIDNVERMSFDNWAEHDALYPETAPMTEMAYPRAKAHRQVPAAVRRAIAQRVEALSSTAGLRAA